jgi:hypothetical protein
MECIFLGTLIPISSHRFCRFQSTLLGRRIPLPEVMKATRGRRSLGRLLADGPLPWERTAFQCPDS